MGIISSSVTLAAAVVQALAMFFFTYRIMKACGEPMGAHWSSTTFRVDPNHPKRHKPWQMIPNDH